MHGPATSVVWQTAFGKDFWGMAQGNVKTWQKGMYSIFVMTHAEIPHIPKNQTVTYACVVVDVWPQQADLHRICITTSGNLINYLGKLSTCTINLTTSKLMWNSTVSSARRGLSTCAWTSRTFTSVHPWTDLSAWKFLFPSFHNRRYNNMTWTCMHWMDTFTLRCDALSGASPRPGSLPASSSASTSCHIGTMNVPTSPACGDTKCARYCSRQLLTILG